MENVGEVSNMQSEMMAYWSGWRYVLWRRFISLVIKGAALSQSRCLKPGDNSDRTK